MIYQVGVWYYEHLGAQKPIVLVSEDPLVVETFCHLRVEVFVMSLGSYLNTFWPYLIFVIFSPRAQFLAKFFSTQNRVNRTKTGFATKQRKLQKKLIWQQNIVKCNKTP